MLSETHKPFLKWPGGKYKLIGKIIDMIPLGNRFYEPFVGGGSVFSNLVYPRYTISDKNEDLISLYKQFKKEGLGFIDYCETFFLDAYNRSEIFYGLRLLFNQTEDARLKTALFLYLNRHSFNGLVRYNLDGEFNAPFGKYKKPYFPRNEMKLFLPKLRKATVLHSDYKKVLGRAVHGDVCYLDPPYAPIEQSSNFTQYSSCSFGTEEQVELAAVASKLSRSGVTVLVSNHDTSFTRDIYREAKINSFYVQRNISCDGKTRVKAKELLALFEAKG